MVAESIFGPAVTTQILNAVNPDTLMSQLGIEVIEVGPNFIRARMPVDERTHQPFGLLHGGASAALAETLGSMASASLLDLQTHIPMGLTITAHHLRSVMRGFVYGTVTPVHVGRRTHVWDIHIVDDADHAVCVSRLTVLIVERPAAPGWQEDDAERPEK